MTAVTGTKTAMSLGTHCTALGRATTHPVSAAGGVVNSFFLWSKFGPEATVIENTLYVTEKPGFWLDGSGYKQVTGAIGIDTYDDDTLKVGGFTNDTVARPTVAPTYEDIAGPTHPNGRTNYYVYAYMIDDGRELPYSTVQSHTVVRSPTGDTIVSLPSGAIGTRTIIDTHLYREPWFAIGNGPWKYVWSTGGNGGDVTDNVADDLLGNSPWNDQTTVPRPWRTMLCFDTSGIYGNVVAAKLRFRGYPDAGNNGWRETFISEGNDGGDGFGHNPFQTVDYSAFPGAGFTSGGSLFVKPVTTTCYMTINAAGRAVINDAITHGNETHIGIKNVDEVPEDFSYWQFYSQDGATSELQRPALILTLEEIGGVTGFPNKFNRTMLELMSR